jgi:alanyl-tRNA synthetase
MTERLYYTDCYLTKFRATVVEAAGQGCRVYLDRTAFYPASGGQPFDLGTLSGIPVLEVVDEEDRIAHILAGPLRAAGEVEGAIDWHRRYDHMQQHTGQHLLSAVLEELFGAATVSFHLGGETSTIDVKAASLSPAQLQRAEERCAQIAGEARPTGITFEAASGDLGLRKASQREGSLRIVSIEGIDRSACGGTHVRSTAEVAPILIRRLENVRDTIRIEFVCGGRALARAREDLRLLTTLSRSLASSPEKTPGLVAGLIEKNKALEKTAQRLATELARREGRELYLGTSPGPGGIRRHTERGAIDETMRARAQAFVSGGKAVFLAVSEDPGAVLLAASTDSGVHAGDRVKAAALAAGGRGGGNQTLAQASAPDLDELVRALEL